LRSKKAKYSYGILESNSEVYSKASATKGVTVKFLQLCEARLDNVVFRMGIALLEEVHNLFLTDTLPLMVM
jgi:small subunit ribosomal protein S4